MIFNHIMHIPNYDTMHYEYFECIMDMCYRNDLFEGNNRADQLLQLLMKMVAQSYQKWNDIYRRKSREAFRKVVDKVIYWLKSLKVEERQGYVSGTIEKLCKTINNTNMALFNMVFIEAEIWKIFSNNPFQKMMTEYAEK